MNPMTKTLLWHLGLGLMVLVLSGFGGVTSAADHWLELKGEEITVAVGKDLALKVYRGSGEPVWSTRESSTPAVAVQIIKPDGKKTVTNIRLGEAAGRKVEDYDDGLYKGHRIRLSELPGVDVEVELVLALGTNDELLVQVEQVGGKNSVRRVAGLYDWKIQPAADSYMVVPRGSGYIIRSDSPKAARLGGFIGAAYSLPMFGIVAGNQTCQQIIDTWWDAKVSGRPHAGQRHGLVAGLGGLAGQIAVSPPRVFSLCREHGPRRHGQGLSPPARGSEAFDHACPTG